ncbi:hypothetical protein [Neptuniibacter caesariensis]|uniref:Metallo-beta-lactamase domain-containing protein n=1 Tax=Neptuniibacter caesariensis TaxID=207954 RepID=A0A7U8C5D4_NEPCE|nr:hypothetical protein [Neptuniibacter caesariensis]EAR61793.1 hypothetical protein MED92_04322 [Neptuniibacter caesariensis]
MNFPEALAHGDIKEVFKDVFMVTGTMRNEFFGSIWQFSRNMVIVREEGRLTLINSVRLNDAGLAKLDELGTVANIVRIGDMHGLDDRFYLDRYASRNGSTDSVNFWALPDMGVDENSTSAPPVNKLLSIDGEMPLSNCSLFVFETTKRPEAILRLDRDGGIMIACDALQNWVEPDEFFDAATIEKMREIGFFTPAGVGPAWIQGNEPQPGDFERLSKMSFKHVLCGHGEPLLETAQADFKNTFQRLFGIAS